MIVSEVDKIDIEDARYAAQFFIDYFGSVNGDISTYMRRNKLALMPEDNSLPGMGPEDELFCDFDMSPEDMEFVIEEVEMSKFAYYLNIVSSHNNEMSVPGKILLLMVREKHSGQIVGFIRIGSPTINSKPRNQWLGEPLDSKNLDMMKRFNESVIMGFVIVPTQPFGFNYLGGKLLSAIACSHYVRDKMNDKYGINVCGFETTSLYGSTKSSSQYDGMKPFLRYTGLTESNFMPAIVGEEFHFIHNWFREKIGGLLCLESETSKKMKQQGRMVRIMNNSLGDDPLKQKLKEVIEGAIEMQEQKRSYIGTYGFSNVPDYLTLKTDTLNKAENYDRFELNSVIEWWRKKATKRYESLKTEGRLRTKLETWNINPEDIDIIR